MRLEPHKEEVFLAVRRSEAGQPAAAGLRAMYGDKIIDEMLAEDLLEEAELDVGNGFHFTVLRNTDKARR